MDEDEAVEAMGELYRDGLIDLVDRQRGGFSLNEVGEKHAEQLLRENPEHVKFLCEIHINEYGSGELTDFLFWLRDELDINPLESLIEADPEWLDSGGIEAETIAEFDPQ